MWPNSCTTNAKLVGSFLKTEQMLYANAQTFLKSDHVAQLVHNNAKLVAVLS
jgi:hypothetical protein